MTRATPTQTTPGSLDEAVARGEELLRVDPAAALQQAQVILKKDRREPRALRIAAAAHRARGEHQYAGRAELLAIEEGRRYPMLRQAAQALGQGDFGKASELAAQHIRAFPQDLAALTLSAESALGIGLTEQAISLFGTILERAPDFGHARVLLVNALMLSDRLAEAREQLDRLLAASPENRSLLALSNRLHNGAGEFAACVETTERTVALDPGSPDIHADHADALRFSGQRDRALASYRRALELAPGHARSWWSMADLDASSITGSDVEVLQGLLGEESTAADARVNLHFALAIAQHLRGEHKEAFKNFAAGNSLRSSQEPHSASAFHASMMEQLDRAHSGLPVAKAGKGQLTPVFIVGMPRAGSTLLERMLAQSDAVEAMGELQIVPHMVKRIEVAAGSDKLNDTIANLSERQLASHGQWYRDRVAEAMKTGASHPIDKMHMNWRHLSLILRSMPEARVIDIRRDAMDCCWSNYRTLFSKGHAASNDLADIGRFYRTYVDFAEGMRAAFEDRIMLVKYEELVDEPEKILTEVCRFLGITYSDDMLAFHRSAAPVATASSEQVRQPLNRRGIGAWKPYAAHLAPLREALGDG